MHEYEILMYAVNSCDLTLKEEYQSTDDGHDYDLGDLFCDLSYDGTLEKYGLDYDYADDGCYIGLRADPRYPWSKRPMSKLNTKEKVKDAVAEVLQKYVKESPDTIKERVDYVETYGLL